MTPPHDRFVPESYEDYKTRGMSARERAIWLRQYAEECKQNDEDAAETEHALREDKFEDWKQS